MAPHPSVTRPGPFLVPSLLINYAGASRGPGTGGSRRPQTAAAPGIGMCCTNNFRLFSRACTNTHHTLTLCCFHRPGALTDSLAEERAAEVHVCRCWAALRALSATDSCQPVHGEQQAKPELAGTERVRSKRRDCISVFSQERAANHASKKNSFFFFFFKKKPPVIIG